ncbi:MAG: hypothetical protein FWH08_00255 [Oscillospiraceae bacterium]|nr:hypothetical protein [Oscillospiraceae bacterium]
MKICFNCGHDLSEHVEGATVCQKCGVNLNQNSQEQGIVPHTSTQPSGQAVALSSNRKKAIIVVSVIFSLVVIVILIIALLGGGDSSTSNASIQVPDLCVNCREVATESFEGKPWCLEHYNQRKRIVDSIEKGDGWNAVFDYWGVN